MFSTLTDGTMNLVGTFGFDWTFLIACGLKGFGCGNAGLVVVAVEVGGREPVFHTRLGAGLQVASHSLSRAEELAVA